MVRDCVLIVQSHVLSSSFNPQIFFSGSLLIADFDAWKSLRLGDVAAFVDRYESFNGSYLSHKS